MTLRESVAAMGAFAGEDAEVAVVEPAALADFDDFARYYELTHGRYE